LLFFTSLIIQVQAIKPAINAAIKPIIKTETLPIPVVSAPSTTSFPIFPKMRGMTIKKEKRAALLLSFPSSTDVEIVKALGKETFFPVFLALSAK